MSTTTVPGQVHPALRAILLSEVRRGMVQPQRSLVPWLFYDERGSALFEEITRLPEYYLTRTERALFEGHAAEIVQQASGGAAVSVVELGAGTASKSGVILSSLAAQQGEVLYQPLDVSESALAEAERSLRRLVPGIRIRSQVVDYTSGALTLERPAAARVLALYIGSSIGNFEPTDAREVLSNLRAALEPGDSLLLGTDLAPGPNKTAETLLAAYDDAAGVTAAFNVNVLARLNRDVGTDFELEGFCHVARWNEAASRIEMHLQAIGRQRVRVPADEAGPAMVVEFAPGETIHTENSYKFTAATVDALLRESGFATRTVWRDAQQLFAVTLAFAR